MSKQLITKAQDNIVQEKEDKIVSGIKSKLESIKDKEETIKEYQKQIKELKKELIEIETGNYDTIANSDGPSFNFISI